MLLRSLPRLHPASSWTGAPQTLPCSHPASSWTGAPRTLSRLDLRRSCRNPIHGSEDSDTDGDEDEEPTSEGDDDYLSSDGDDEDEPGTGAGDAAGAPHPYCCRLGPQFSVEMPTVEEATDLLLPQPPPLTTIITMLIVERARSRPIRIPPSSITSTTIAIAIRALSIKTRHSLTPRYLAGTLTNIIFF